MAYTAGAYPGFCTGFVRVLASPEISLWHLPGLESPGKRLSVLERSGNLFNSSNNKILRTNIIRNAQTVRVPENSWKICFEKQTVCSIKFLEVFLLLPGWDASPLQGYP